MAWVTKELPHLEEWRVLAVEWLGECSKNIKGRLDSIKFFLSKYLDAIVCREEGGFLPKDVLLRTRRLPPLKSASSEFISARYFGTLNCHIVEFVDWILLHEFSLDDDVGMIVTSPAYHNPFSQVRTKSAGTLKSVRSPLPYGYIDELRQMIAQGPNFSDWSFAQSAMGGKHRAPDYFNVESGKIDDADRDCVGRQRATVARGKFHEMWSPVRWVALLLKLQLPLRTMQVRLLDSGEADTWRYEYKAGRGSFVKAKGLLIQGTDRKPWSQGVFRRVPHREGCLIYVNTNKTKDSETSGPEKGYDFPWPESGPQHVNPLVWLAKLRDWQEKYNPVERLTAWTELTSTHINVKSDEQLANYPDACFLFRLPEAQGQEHLPANETALETPWYYLLKSFEERLAARGETHPDGSKIVLVRSKMPATEFPLHSLRVSLVTALGIDGKVPFPVLQKITGHSRLVMLLYYVNPEDTRILAELEKGVDRLDASKHQSIVEFLRTGEYKELVRKAVTRSPESFVSAVPAHPASRNAAGWMPMHHGLCLVGGNVSPLPGNLSVGGCYNGGVNLGNVNNEKFTPVPGGARNCIRCRWFVTKSHYVPALVAHMNVLLYHFNEAQNECIKLDRLQGRLRGERAEAEERKEVFSKINELRAIERRYESAMARFSSFAEDVQSCNWFIQKCFELGQAENGAGTLLARGSAADFRAAVEEVNSELMQLSVVCESVEHFPDLQSGKAVVRRSQLLDAALAREGHPPIFLLMSEEEQLVAGNSFMRELSNAFNPRNPALGSREVISIIDSGKCISDHSGIDFPAVVRSSVGRPAGARVRALGDGTRSL
ncbi:integrase [Paraburkholderia sp. JPY432]|nr:integrase [Paraburkholderia youngii]